MTELKLAGPLELSGALHLNATEVLAGGKAIVVITELQTGESIWVTMSVNQTVKVSNKAVVTGPGTCKKGPTGPQGTFAVGTSTILVNGISLNVFGDPAIVQGAPVSIDNSGQ